MIGLEVRRGKLNIALTENGAIPDLDELIAYHAGLSWFAIWRDFVRDTDHNEISHLAKVYNSDYVITLDNLPWIDLYVGKEFTKWKIIQKSRLRQ